MLIKSLVRMPSAALSCLSILSTYHISEKSYMQQWRRLCKFPFFSRGPSCFSWIVAIFSTQEIQFWNTTCQYFSARYPSFTSSPQCTSTTRTTRWWHAGQITSWNWQTGTVYCSCARGVTNTCSPCWQGGSWTVWKALRCLNLSRADECWWMPSSPMEREETLRASICTRTGSPRNYWNAKFCISFWNIFSCTYIVSCHVYIFLLWVAEKYPQKRRKDRDIRRR